MRPLLQQIATNRGDVMSNYIHREEVICPHCDHPYDADDMNSAGEDLWALAPNESDADIKCVICGDEFVIRGSYRPVYSTAFSSEELDYHT